MALTKKQERDAVRALVTTPIVIEWFAEWEWCYKPVEIDGVQLRG